MAEPIKKFGVFGGARSDAQVAVDQGLRGYMLRVYNYMGSGLALSGIVAYFAATSGLWKAIAGTPLMWVVIFAPIGMLLLVGFRAQRMSAAAVQAFYWAFVVLMGLSLAQVFLIYTATSIAKVLFITAGTFGAMSLWGYTTKTDLSKFGSFLLMGAIGLLIAMVVNIFLASSMMGFVISVIGVLVFTGLTAYDTQRIRQEYDYVSHDGTLMTKSAIFGALNLYLNFVNLFQFLLALLGNRE
jgi:FtsH-binding integral membrane protein